MAFPFDRDRAPEDGPLSDRPRALTPPSDPFEGEASEDPIWPLGDKTVRGRLLASFSSAWLLHQRNDLARRAANSRTEGEQDDYLALMQQIDDELSSRGGE